MEYNNDRCEGASSKGRIPVSKTVNEGSNPSAPVAVLAACYEPGKKLFERKEKKCLQNKATCAIITSVAEVSELADEQD